MTLEVAFPHQQNSFRRKRAEHGGLERGKGIAILARSAGARCERSWGKILQPVVLPALRGKALCGKEAFLLT
ncbi:hypothetical protein [Mucilaginibacter sp. AK015]|uniref:hypothetical protein n=1 Tax=Mucilaginibacter sp. AK015 TaxID=2723072 RepID=UPI00160EDC6B|nr:hypothetical protein [Mucilaginibacter sp. AK015]MBB5397757.1 hypothetical protein [Mucilaginibacter sp. AK015]